MRASFLSVAVVGALVGTSPMASGDNRGGGRSSSQSHAGGRSVADRGSRGGDSSRSGRTSHYRAERHDSSNRGEARRYRTGGERRSSSYRDSRHSSYRNRSHYGYRSYYRPGFSLYLGSPYYYGYGYGAYYPETYAYPEAAYAAAPYATDYGYDGRVLEPEDAGAPYDRDTNGYADAANSSRLRLDVRPVDATIYVDDQFHGTADRDTVLLLTPGRHRIEIARPGYQTERRVVDVGIGDARSLSIALQPARR